MSTHTKTAIVPTRAQNYSEWYQQVIKAAELAEVSPVRGCMIIKPWGYALWENMQRIVDAYIKSTGHKNVYFPLLIPVSFLEKEAEHVEGFAKECAVVTHSRLVNDGKGKLIPDSPLEDLYIIRPTSETIIGEAFSRWIQSYRDLPLLINQWANVMRWEMRTRLFLRTAEFLWQEGHTAHSTAEEAQLETLTILDFYESFAKDYLAMPVIKGEKTENERFPGAVNTYCIEAMMQDGKALQAGTSHFLGQNFAKAFDINFLDDQGLEQAVWTTSWGITTRLIGALVMTHSDDNGLVIPPKIAPLHVVILPILHQEQHREAILAYCQALIQEIKNMNYAGHPIQVEIDCRDVRGGEKMWSWVKKGVPLRIEIGQKECEQQTVFIGRRDQDGTQRYSDTKQHFIAHLPLLLDEIQTTLYQRALQFRESHTKNIYHVSDFHHFFDQEKGFAIVYWNGTSELEESIKKEFGVTIRCILLETDQKPGACIFTGNTTMKRAVFAKAY